jgi:hypothetical protein
VRRRVDFDGVEFMADRVRNYSAEKGLSDSAESEIFPEKDLLKAGSGADPRDVASFADSLAKKKHGSDGADGGEFFDKSGSISTGEDHAGAARSDQRNQHGGEQASSPQPKPGDKTNANHGVAPHSESAPVGGKNLGEQASSPQPKPGDKTNANHGVAPHGESASIGGKNYVGQRAGEGPNDAKREHEKEVPSGVRPRFSEERGKRTHGYTGKILQDGDMSNVANFDDSASAGATQGVKILESLAMQRIEPQSQEAASVIKSLGVQVAEKIIASYEALNAKQEVRVTLQDSVLKDTEVLISKDGKAISVNFVTGSDESASILNHRSGELRMQLMEKLNGIDHIDIEIEHQNANDNQNNDGRSRNRHDSQWEENTDEDDH